MVTHKCESEIISNSLIKWKFWKSRRHIVTIMGIWGFFNLYAARATFSFAVVAMTQFVYVTNENGSIVEQQEYEWDSRQKGLVLGSFFYGYLWTHVIGGVLATRFGGNTIFGLGTGMSSLLTIVSPGVARLGLYPLVTVRILIGLCQGLSIPSMQDVYANWAPEFEVTTMTGLVQSGSQIGIFISFLLSGYFIEYFGWESIFYIFGGFGAIWFILWAYYIKRTPSDDPRVSYEEKAYIESNMRKRNNLKGTTIPWWDLLTSKAVWAQSIAGSFDSFATFTFLTQIPAYLKDVLNYNLGATGILAATPYLLFIFLTPIASSLSDYLRSSKILSTLSVRKIFISSGFLIGAICIVIMSHSTDLPTIWTCLIIAIGMSTFTKVSYFTNAIDFAPAFASIAFGFASTLSTVPGIIAPTLVGFIVRNGTQEEWKVVFYVVAGFAVSGMIFFCLLGQGKVQEWAKYKSTETDKSLEPLNTDIQLCNKV